MKRILLFVLTLLSISITAQNRPMLQEKREKIKTMKIAFITNELSLTPNEAEKFWPIYNTFEEKQHSIRRNKLMNDNPTTLSESEAKALLEKMINSEEELYLARKKFMLELKSVLPATKIIKLRKAEEDFKRKLLKLYRNQEPKD